MRKALWRALDLLSLLVLAVAVLIFVTGGFTITLGDSRVSAHSIRNPAIAFTVLVLIAASLCVPGGIRHLRVFRQLGELATRAEARLATRPRLARSIPWIAAALYTVAMSALTIRKHHAFQSHAFDLGIFDQLLWNSAHGNLLHSSVLGERHFFGEHVSPILLLLVPIYWLPGSLQFLLGVQSLALASGAIAVHALAGDVLGGRILPIVLACVYLCYPPLRGVNLYDFHPIALVTPLLLFAFLYLHRGRLGPSMFFLALAVLCQEEVALTAACFGLFMALKSRRRIAGMAVMVACMVLFVLDLAVIIPAVRGAAFPFVDRYRYLGDNLPEIVRTFFSQPLLVWRHVLIAEKGEYLLQIFGPVGFLALLSPAHLAVAAPTILQNLLSDSRAQYSIDYQYTSALMPFVFVAAIFGIARVLSRRAGEGDAGIRARLHVAVFLVTLSFLFQGRSPVARWRDYHARPDLAGAAGILETLPEPLSVSAQEHLVPHLSHRAHLYQFPDTGPSDAEVIVLDTHGGTTPLKRDAYLERTAALLREGRYGVWRAAGPILILRKDWTRERNEEALRNLVEDRPAARPR